MCAAIDATLGAISSGTVHSRVGACDSRGLFAKRVLHDDSQHALAIASSRYLIQKNLTYACELELGEGRNLVRLERLTPGTTMKNDRKHATLKPPLPYCHLRNILLNS